MQIIRRVGVILIWLAGLAFVFAAANKNDPYLISMRGPGNIVLAVVSIAAFIGLICRRYRLWPAFRPMFEPKRPRRSVGFTGRSWRRWAST
jgi:hypothetical protein